MNDAPLWRNGQISQESSSEQPRQNQTEDETVRQNQKSKSRKKKH